MNVKEVKKIKSKLYFLLIIINLVLLYCTYKIMPIIQNYPPNSENIAFQKSVEQFSHVEQYFMIFIVATSLHIFALNKALKNICDFLNKYHKKQKISYDEIKIVRKDCINVPYKFYIIQMIVVLILGMTLTLILISNGLAILKFFLMLFAITSLIEIIQFILIQKELKEVMKKTYMREDKYEISNGVRLKYSTNLILQIIPFIAVSIIIISLIGYAKATEEYAKANANYYKAYLENRNLDGFNISTLKKELETIPLNVEEDYFFIIAPDFEEIYVSKEGEEITDFFVKYLNFYFKGNSGIVYEFYGTEKQAYTVKLQDNQGKSWYVGFEYSTADTQLMAYYVSIIVGALIVYTIFIYILAKNISNNIENVSNSLKDILEESGKEHKNKLPILSNDEIGDLSYYYNKIVELTEEHEKELRDNEYVMQRQAQFAILGEFAGGIAHDLNSPLSAVQLDVSTLKKYIKSDKISAEDETREDLIEMLNNIDSSLEKMSKTIAGVRNQIRATGDTEKEKFSVKEMVDGIEILFGSLLRRNNCQLINNVKKDYFIVGEKNKLDRVVGNIIKNSIDAYQEKEKNGIIEVFMKERENKYIISIRDEAGGIPEQIQKTLFKEMKTTKKDNGTGFGLYYSNTIIESSFKGKITFNCTENIGTIFNIEIPILKEKF